MQDKSLFESLTNYCHSLYISTVCDNCDHFASCPSVQCGNCKQCLEEIHYPNRNPNGRKDYECDRMMNFYVCDYTAKYASEMLYLMRRCEALNTIEEYHVLSLGCGACPDLIALEKFCKESSQEKRISYLGIDVNERWKPIHEQIQFPAGIHKFSNAIADGCDNFKTVKGYENTYAEEFAKSGGYEFISLGINDNPYINVTDVKLDKDILRLRLGETGSLKATVIPENANNKKVTWFSDNEEIAIVDQNGNVRGISAGQTSILVRTDEGEFAESCFVFVEDNHSVDIITGISLNKTYAAIPTNESLILSAVVTPSTANQSIVWSSSDESVATVDQTGRVTGVKAGLTTVTATTVNGLFATCEVRVLFKDVADSKKFYYDPVYWALDNNITTGTSPVDFTPGADVTRGQIVAFLYRAAGEPAVSGEMPFTDVKEGKFYYNAVLWAYKNGITTGTSDTTFSPNGTCIRSQIVTFLWRYCGSEEFAPNDQFTDVKKGSFYEKAVAWAVKKGVTTGTSPTTFSPIENCTRGQAVTFLYRAVKDK